MLVLIYLRQFLRKQVHFSGHVIQNFPLQH